MKTGWIDSCDSTNNLASELGRSGAPHGTWIAAGQQFAGRGRQGRSWESQPGNLYLSVVFYVNAGSNSRSMLTWIPLTAALAVSRIVENLGVHRSKIKWPNDLWVDGKKLAGILCEYHSTPKPFIVVGIGMNCVHSPENATHLKACGAALTDPKEIAPLLASELQRQMDILSRGGRDEMRIAYLEHSLFQQGEPVTWQNTQGCHRGSVMSIGPQGELLVQSNGAIQSLFAEDVFSVRAAH